MPYDEVTAHDLRRRNGGTSCCKCSNAAADAPNRQVWYVWNGAKLYCPSCAESHGIV